MPAPRSGRLRARRGGLRSSSALRCRLSLLLASIVLAASAGTAGPSPASATAAEPPATPAPVQAETAEPGESEAGPHLQLYWKDGVQYRVEHTIRLQSGEYRLLEHDLYLSGRICARLQVDVAGYVPSRSLSNVSDGIAVRRFFINTTGEFDVALPIQFRFELGVKENRFFLWLFEYGYADVTSGPTPGQLYILQARMQVVI